MKIIKTKEKTVQYKTEEYDLGDEIKLVVDYIDGKISKQHIPCQYKYRHLLYVKSKTNFLSLFKERYFYNVMDLVDDYKIEDLKSHFKENEIDKDSLFMICTHDHTLRNYKSEPIPILRKVDYISGFVQKDKNDPDSYGYSWDWCKLRNFLSSHEKVLNLKEIEIPYYNRDFYGQKAFEFDVLHTVSFNLDKVHKMIEFLGIDVEELCD